MGTEAKRYLQEHALPQLFEGLITGLICNKPEDPIGFLENSLNKVRQNPNLEYKWDSFVDEKLLRECEQPSIKADLKAAEKPKKAVKSRKSSTKQTKKVSSNKLIAPSTTIANSELPCQPTSVMPAAEPASIPDVPIILFMGGPGGGKTRHAARIQEALAKFGLAHICMPDIIRAAIAKYQNTDAKWKEAAQSYQRGELIPNDLALGLVKAEMSKHQDAKVFFLEGFPREARQVESFEREVRPVNMAMILDYDESTLRQHMENRGIDTEVIDAKIREFKLKTLPSAKYFDDQRLLHLIPGEQTDQWIFERMKLLIQRAMELGIPVTTSKVPSRTGSPLQRLDTSATIIQAAAIVEAAVATTKTPENQSSPTATKDKVEENEKKEDPELTKPAKKQIEVGSATSVPGSPISPVTARNIMNHAPKTAPEKEKPAKIRNISKQKSLGKENEIHEIKPEKDKRTLESETNMKVPLPKATSDQLTDRQSSDTKLKSPPTDKRFPLGAPNNALIVIIIGPPGSCKDEISKHIAKRYDGFVYISMSDLLRKEVKANSDDQLWQRIGEKMDAGESVPTKICRELLYSKIYEEENNSKGYVIEGYPRTKNQATDFEKQVIQLDLVILIDCTEEFCIEAIGKRKNNEMMISRPDESSEALTTRLQMFKENTLPMLKYFDDKKNLKVVDGDNSLEKIFDEIIEELDSIIHLKEQKHEASNPSSEASQTETTA